MDLYSVARALTCDAALGIRALRQYNDPLSEKEWSQLQALRQRQLEQLDAGLRVEETPEEMVALASRPIKAFHPLAVVQCVLATARLPYVDRHTQRVLQRQVLPYVAAATPLEVGEWASAINAALQMPLHHSATCLQCAEHLLRVCSPAIFGCVDVDRPTHNKKKKTATDDNNEGDVEDGEEKEGVTSARATLRVLRAMYKLPRSVHLVERKAEVAARGTSHSLAEARVLYWQLMAEVMRQAAGRHGRRRQHNMRDTTTPVAREVFLTSAGVRRLRQCIQLCLSTDDLQSMPELPVWLQQSIAALDTRDTAAVAVLLAHPSLALSKEQLLSLIKSHPGTLQALLGGPRHILPDTLPIRAPHDAVLQSCLYGMGLTIVTHDAFLDYCAVLLAMAPMTAVRAYMLSHGTEAFAQLLVPFVNNAKVLTTAVAREVGPLYAQLLRQLCDSSSSTATDEEAERLVRQCMEAVVSVLTNRCRAATEKASVLRIAGDLCAILPPSRCARLLQQPSHDDEQDIGLVAMLDREVAIPVVESARQALRVVRLLGAESLVAEGLAEALRNARKDTAIRRALLVQLGSGHTTSALMEEFVLELLKSCEEVEVVRADALLGTRFVLPAHAALVARLCPLLATAEVCGQLCNTASVSNAINGSEDAGDEDECERTADVAIALAQAGQCGPMAMLLTSRSGQLRRRLLRHLQSVAGDVGAVISLWDSMTKVVFGLEAAQKPRILSSSASVALRAVATALLSRHTSRVTLAPTLTELLLCCGHDSVQGEDPFFYRRNADPLRRHRQSCLRVRPRILRDVLGEEHVSLLGSVHGAAVTDGLLTALNSSHEHVAIAACRAFALLLSLTKPPTSRLVFQKLLDAVVNSTRYFCGLDARDRAIAAADADEMARYEDATLRAQQLIKTFAERPPKGVSVEDYEYAQKEAAVALAKGTAALRAAVARRAEQLAPVVARKKLPLLAVRLVGTSGGFDMGGVAVLYPHLQAIINSNYESEGEDATTLCEGDATKAERLPIAELLSECRAPSVLAGLALDAIVALLSHTPLGLMAESMACTVARLRKQTYLTAKDVSGIAVTAHALRQAVTQMLPAPLFVVLVAFAQVAFKPGKGGSQSVTSISVATQHQLLGLLLQNIGQTDLPDAPAAMELLANILQSFPALYKSVQLGFVQLMPLIPLRRLDVVEAGLFHAVDTVREVTAVAFTRFAHFAAGARRALLLAAVFAQDDNATVARAAQQIVQDARYHWSLQPIDWADLVYLLATYGSAQRANAARIVQTMRPLFLAATAVQQLRWAQDIMHVGGLASVVALEALSASYQGGVAVEVMNYLCTVLESPTTSEAVMKEILGAGRVVLNDTALETLRAMAPELQNRLAKPPREATVAKKEQYLATATVWLTIISCRLQEVQLLESIMEQQSRILNNSQSAMVHRAVCESMVEITRNATVRDSPKLDEFVEKCLKQIFHSGSYIKKKAHAWGLVGVLKGLGLPSLRRYGIPDAILKSAKEKQSERSGAMVLLEVMCERMGASFEPYALALSQVLLEGVADPDPKISDCADDASRAMMGHLTGIGLRQLVPHLIAILAAEQAKKRVAPLNFIGYVAFCSPKQLAAALPQIMKHINACLFDVNNAVAVAAFNALRRVAGVVSSPEIQEHVELVLNAMRSPSTDTENALDALLYTRFVNVVDPASLALIIPVIARGLGGQLPRTRPKAAQIVASMVNLVADSKTLEPYTDELVHLLEEASQDPQSEARTTAARALGALAAAIGGSLVDDIATWSFSILQRIHSGTIEKAGAAQVFVELVHACGSELLQVYYPTIEAGMRDERPPVREGFLCIMVYAPSTLSSEVFQSFLPVSFPWVLEGLSHFSDKVRDVALTAGDSIISLYGTRNLPLMLEPLLNGVQSEVTTMRQSSLLLSAKLLLHLVALIRKRMRIQSAMDSTGNNNEENNEEETTEEGGAAAAMDGATAVLTMESARSVEKRGVSVLGSLEEMLGTQALVQLLSAVYCGRNEHNASVRGDCNLAWQACVASIRAAVNKIFTSLVELLLHFCASDNADCVEVAGKTIEYTTSMNEMIERFVDAFCESYKTGDDRTRLGALVGLATIVQFADAKRLISMGGQIVGCVLPGMQDSQGKVREAAREVFSRVTKSVGSRLIESAVEAQLTTSVRGVVEVVKVRPNVALAIIFKHLEAQSVYTESNRDLLDSILDVEAAQDDLVRYADPLARILLAMLVQGDLDGVSATMQKYVEVMPRTCEAIPIEHFQKAMNIPSARRGALLAAEAYGLGTHIDNVDGITAVWRAVLTTLGDEDDDVTRAHAVRIVPRLINSLEQRLVDTLGEEERADVTSCKRAASRYLLQYLDTFHATLAVTMRAYVTKEQPAFIPLGEGEPRLFDVLMGFYNRGLDYGTPQLKVDAVRCIQDLLEFAPRAISAAAANTVAGRCSKVLFTRNEGSVVHALVQLCLQLLHYPASGKEKMVEGTMALAMFNAALCDSGPARALALRVVVELLRRSVKYADLILGTVLTKKASVDSPLLRTVMCRFLSTVMRYADFEKAFPHISKLMDLVRPVWEAAESPAQAAAAGVALGALCKSASVTEDELGDIKERTLAASSTRGPQAIAGYALIFSLITAAPRRTDQTFLEVAADNLASAASGGGMSDKMSSMWILRAAAAVASTRCVPVSQFRPEAYVTLLRRVNAADEQAMSSAHYFVNCVTEAYTAAVTGPLFSGLSHEPSSQWVALGHFDANFDDEVVADTVY